MKILGMDFTNKYGRNERDFQKKQCKTISSGNWNAWILLIALLMLKVVRGYIECLQYLIVLRLHNLTQRQATKTKHFICYLTLTNAGQLHRQYLFIPCMYCCFFLCDIRGQFLEENIIICCVFSSIYLPTSTQKNNQKTGVEIYPVDKRKSKGLYVFIFIYNPFDIRFNCVIDKIGIPPHKEKNTICTYIFYILFKKKSIVSVSSKEKNWIGYSDATKVRRKKRKKKGYRKKKKDKKKNKRKGKRIKKKKEKKDNVK
ncbi:hypothetical protein RFI_35483 [Reticulomyxa filosa]|uniref:Uncharacterized protein n=1 Tax=Reticulomyxa filosa TaxID=46433 RepID=X6LKS9_RETFI|nr:hypothetical protein RFI_35483 [Reticulomyxa filosa]|eukprot:ETO01956.1 hypothetical protein RFI_35483 [Reticulomyxa filosa]